MNVIRSLMQYSQAPTPHLKRTMFFIDGGYYRKILADHFDKHIYNNPEKIALALTYTANLIKNFQLYNHSQLDVIRIYYYDGKVQADDPKYTKMDTFFNELDSEYDSLCPLELKYGRLIKSENGYRQKGVDVLLSVDMVVKAFQDHYDVAILIAGDDDFVDAVKVVKDLTGKRVFGLIRPDITSQRLNVCLDRVLKELPLPFFEGLKI